MPIFVQKVDRELRQIDVVASGKIHFADIEKHLAEEGILGALPYKEFIDATGATLSFALTPSEIRRVLSLIRERLQQAQFGPTAVVVPNDYVLGIVAALEIFVDADIQIKGFRTEAEARSWLESARANVAGA